MDKRFVTIKAHYSPTEARLEKGARPHMLGPEAGSAMPFI